jgi:FlaA1/EpsC-like NDP-sugar epimerase
VYGPRWHHFGLDDALRIVRANLLGSLATAAALLLIDRVGLSRGVVVIDFLLCSTLITGSRSIFRFLEGATGRWSRVGTPVVVVGPLDEAELAVRQLARIREPRLRAVGVADPEYTRVRSRMGAYRLFGGPAALENAMHDTGASAVLLVGPAAEDAASEGLAALERYLEARGSVDVYRLRVSVTALAAKAGAPDPQAQAASRVLAEARARDVRV